MDATTPSSSCATRSITQLLAKPDISVANMPTDYTPGTYTETDYTINLDVSKLVDLAAFYSPLSVAFGLEHRQEKFKVTQGGKIPGSRT